MKKHLNVYLLCLLAGFIYPHLACHAQKKADSKLAKQIIGTWLVKDFEIEAQEAFKNDPEVQAQLKQNHEMMKAQSKSMVNRIAFSFIKGGKFEVKTAQGSVETIIGTWRVENKMLYLKSDNKGFEQSMGKLSPKIENNMLHLGVLGESGMAPPSQMLIFVCKKGNISELDTTTVPYDREPAVRPQLVTSELVDIIVSSKKGEKDGKPCLRIKYNESEEWQDFEADIQDFKYDEGFEYVLKVEKLTNETNDANNTDNIISTVMSYKLINIISRKEK